MVILQKYFEIENKLLKIFIIMVQLINIYIKMIKMNGNLLK